MNLVYTFLDNKIEIKKDLINSIEILNKNYFYRLTNLLLKYCSNFESEEINFNDGMDELKLNNSIRFITNYYDFDFNNKKYINELIKIITNNSNEKILIKINNNYNKIYKLLENLMGDIDLNFEIKINDEFSIKEILKNFNLSIPSKEKLLDNLILLVDIEKELNINKLLVFINLKEYLNYNDLLEFEKYCIYNNIGVILFDSNVYDKTCYESKFIIDNDLNEVVL